MPAEIVAEGLGYAVAILLLHPCMQPLESRSHPFLAVGVAAIEEEEELPPDVALPGQAAEVLALLA